MIHRLKCSCLGFSVFCRGTSKAAPTAAKATKEVWLTRDRSWNKTWYVSGMCLHLGLTMCNFKVDKDDTGLPLQIHGTFDDMRPMQESAPSSSTQKPKKAGYVDLWYMFFLVISDSSWCFRFVLQQLPLELYLKPCRWCRSGLFLRQVLP